MLLKDFIDNAINQAADSGGHISTIDFDCIVHCDHTGTDPVILVANYDDHKLYSGEARLKFVAEVPFGPKDS